MTRVLALIATIPQRRASCERLLRELAKQSRVPDGVLLRYDGHPDNSRTPSCPLRIASWCASDTFSGPGQRWIFVLELFRLDVLDADDIIINLDDDVFLGKAPDLVRALVATVEEGGGAAAAMGRTPDGKQAPPGRFSRGHLIYAAGCGLALCAKHLEGLPELAKHVLDAGGPDALGPRGDDDALVSALLWKKGIRIKHAATGVINAAAGTQEVSQTKARLACGEDLEAQKIAIKRITGWPLP